MSPEEAFQEFWKEKNGGVLPDPVDLAKANIFLKGPEFRKVLQDTFIAGRESVEPIIKPEWVDEILLMHRLNSKFWTPQELSRLFQLPEDKIKEILDVNKNSARQ